MITRTQLEKILWTWARAQIPELAPVIWAHNNAARPQEPYVVLSLVTNVRPGGYDEVSGASDAGVVTIKGNREITVHLQTFGEDSMDYIDLLRTSLEKPTVNEGLSQQGLAYVDFLLSTMVTELIENRFERRWVLDLLFRYAEITEDAPGHIETVNGLGQIVAGDAHKDITFTADLGALI
jgi:hypothetical protein